MDLLLSDSTYSQLGPREDLRQLGEHKLKGRRELVKVYAA